MSSRPPRSKTPGEPGASEVEVTPSSSRRLQSALTPTPAARPRPATVGRAHGGGLRQRPRRDQVRARARSQTRVATGWTALVLPLPSGGFAEARRGRRDPAPRDRPAAGAAGRAHECAAVIAGRVGDIASQARHSEEAYAAFAAAAGEERGMTRCPPRASRNRVGPPRHRAGQRDLHGDGRGSLSGSAIAGTARSR